jgi:hypothetical protein
MKFFKFLKNTKGVTIVQVMIGAGIASAVSLGVVQMMENTRRTQRKVQLLATLQDMKMQMENLIRDQAAFNNTIIFNTGAPYDSLKSGSLVTEFSATSPVKMVLYDASGSDASKLDLLGPADTTGNGFTEKGTRCTTFNATPGSGDDKCPFSYRIMLSADCPITTQVVETSCRDPQLKIVARLVYNPASTSNSVLRNWDKMIAQTDGWDISSDTVGKYDVMIKRTASSIGRTFKISSYVTSGTSLCTVSGTMSLTNVWGAGSCTVSSSVHPTTSSFGWSKDSDPHTIVTTSAVSTGQMSRFRFNEIGSYICSVKAKAIDCDGFILELYNEDGATTVAYTSTVAPSFSETEARLDTTFNVGSVTDDYIIRQRCDRPSANPSPSERTSSSNCRLGFSATSQAFAPITVTCTKMDAAF